MSVSRTNGTTKTTSAPPSGNKDGSSTSMATAVLETEVLERASRLLAPWTKSAIMIQGQLHCPLETSALLRSMQQSLWRGSCLSHILSTRAKKLDSSGKEVTNLEIK